MTAQISLDGMPIRLFACTPAKLGTWLDCPRRYRLQYVERLAVPQRPWAHLSLGSAVHLALAAWWRQPVGERTVASAGRLLRESWVADGFRDDAHSLEWRDRAQEMVERYVDDLDPLDEPLGIERTVATKTARLTVSGRVDRIDARGGEAVIVDYKTGRQVLTVDDARGSLALALYAAAAARTLRRPCRTVELHHLPTGEVARWEHTDESLARLLDRAEQAAAEAAEAEAAYDRDLDDGALDELFPPRTGGLCGYCDFAVVCPQGRAAVPTPKQAWDALPVLEPTAG